MIRFLDHNGQGEILYRRARSIGIKIHASSPGRIQIRQFYFPGWSARMEQGQKIFPVHPSESGLLEFAAPSGNYRIDLSLDPLARERMGQFMTLFSLLASCLLITLSPGLKGGRTGVR
jgi:uncharacterized membrane protein YfhO